MVRRVWGPLVAAVLVACLAPSVAGAHVLDIDTAGGWQPLGKSCNPCQVTLPFSVNNGSTLTNSLYVYNNGLIAVGQAFSSMPNVPYSSPADSPLFAIGFQDTSVLPGYFDYTTLPVATYTPSSNDEFVIFPLLNADYSGFTNAASVEFQPISGDPGAFSMTFNFGVYESSSGLYYPFDIYDLPDYTSSGGDYPYFGFDYGGGGSAYILPANAQEGGQTFQFDFLPASSAPEPSTWVELILGLALLGGAFRARSGRKLAAA